jgi:arabinogalactan endo-1,4-beta-galactosidase
MGFGRVFGALAAAVCMVLATTGVDAIVYGHDLSSAGIMEAQEGASWYTTAGTKSTIEGILGAGGMQSVRLR